mmetsp:Transcript_28496/g.55398  ORF Transcript_28496/g.55398 Transcript_28496/m.55398 type:complete len:716 (+) Transcript_28496:82-2229(+)
MMNQDSISKQYDILSLKLHPMQEYIPTSLLLSHYTRTFIRYVSFYGIDINKAYMHSHYRHQLQFIPGLGPRKGPRFYLDLKQRGRPLESRKAMSPAEDDDPMDDYEDGVRRRLLGTQVFHNCCAFLRITDAAAFPEDRDEVILDPLDRTRIHPEDYVHARDIVKDVTAEDDEEEPEERSSEEMARQIEALADVERHPLLEQLDLEGYAQILESELNETYRKMGRRLELIKLELQHPFRISKPEDAAHPIFGWMGRRRLREPEGRELFNLLTNETDESFREGMVVTARVVKLWLPRVRNDRGGGPMDFRDQPKVIVRLDNGLRGEIVADDVSDEMPAYQTKDEKAQFLQDRVKPDVVVRGRILAIQHRYFSVQLVTRSSALQDTRMEVRRDVDDFLDMSGPTLEEKKMLKRDRLGANRKRQNFKARQVNHPLFKNVSREDAMRFLRANPNDTVIFRPSRSGSDHLTLTWKVAEDRFFHWDVVELNKANPTSLGQVLKLDGQKYEDLDEIEDRFIEPMARHVREIMDNKKFIEVDADNTVEGFLRQDKSEYPNRIPYRFCFSDKHNGYLELHYIPRRSIRKEYISISPKGFKFRNRMFKTLARLIPWFKKHFKDPPEDSKRSRRGVKQERGAGGGGRGSSKLAQYKKGQLVMAVYSTDGKWYNAEIIGPDRNARGYFKLRYPEYGPEEYSVAVEDIKPRQQQQRPQPHQHPPPNARR